jgi:erythromycin esterase-like protein
MVNQKIILKVKALFFTLLLLPALITGQCNSNLNKYITGFEQLKSNSFSFLDGELENVKIVGYGEDTHGSSEFTLIAKELMDYLSKNHKFNILILETGFSEGLYLNDYVQGKRENIKKILTEHNSTWRYNTEEFIALIDWIKNYNKIAKTKIKVYGSEMQYVISDLHKIQDYLTHVGSDYIINGFEKHIWQNITEEEKSDYYISYSKLKSFFTTNHKKFKEKTSDKEFQLVFHQIEVLGQFVSTIHQNVYQRKMDLRDLYISENIEWILNYETKESKALYWAHNVHIGNWISNGIVDVAGHHLKKRFKNAYYNIATDFGTGDFFAFASDPKKDGNGLQKFSFKTIDSSTFTNCLKAQGDPNAFIDLRNAKRKQILKNFLEKPLKTMYGAGSSEWGKQTQTVDIGKAFDAILYINNVNAINFIKE